MFLRSRNQTTPFIFMVCLFVCQSEYLSACLAVCWSVHLHKSVWLSAHLSTCQSVSQKIFRGLYECYLWVCYVSAISRKCVFGHNFWTKAHRIRILVSRTMFWGLRNQMAAFALMVGLSVCPSVYLSAHLSLSQSNQSLSVFSLSSVCPSYGQSNSLSGLYRGQLPYSHWWL